MRHVLAVGIMLAVCASVHAAPVTLSSVPHYNWYHGCGPTAAASIVGYYEMMGFTALYDVDGWDNVKLTNNVKEHISSAAHNAKYDPKPDNPDLPVPENTSLACWFQTSVGSLEYGWSYLSYADNAFSGYADYRGYQAVSYYQSYHAMSFDDLVTEIDAGRPMMFLVDSTGSGGTDHFVPILGYDDRGGGDLWYACYTTWAEGETITWKRYRPMSSSYGWGIGYGIWIDMQARTGDFDTDGGIIDLDIDLLRDHLGDPAYDTDGDLDCDDDDFEHLVNFLVDRTDDGNGTFIGDVNLDGQVNATDLALMKTGFGQTAGYGLGNLNLDPVVDATDLLLMKTVFGNTKSAVPEPTMLTLLAVGAAGLIRRRR